MTATLPVNIHLMQVNGSAWNVANVMTVAVDSQITYEFIQYINRSNVLFAASNLERHMSLLCTVEFTVERNRTNVTCVRKCSVSLGLCKFT